MRLNSAMNSSASWRDIRSTVIAMADKEKHCIPITGYENHVIAMTGYDSLLKYSVVTRSPWDNM